MGMADDRGARAACRDVHVAFQHQVVRWESDPHSRLVFASRLPAGADSTPASQYGS